MRATVVLALAVLALAGCGGGSARPAAPGGSTLATTWRDPDGDGFLSPGPGEPLRDRVELARGRPRPPAPWRPSRS